MTSRQSRRQPKASLPGSLVKCLQCATGLEKKFLYDEIFIQECYLCREKGYSVDIDPSWSCIVDVGANIGLFSMFCAENMAGKGKIYALEPVPQTYGYLKHNIDLYMDYCRNTRNGDTPEIVPLELGICGSHDDHGNTIGYGAAVEFISFPNAHGWSCLHSVAEAHQTSMKRDLRVFIQNSMDRSSSSIPRWLLVFGRYLQTISPLAYEWIVSLAVWILTLGARAVVCQCTNISNVIKSNRIHRIDLLKIDIEGGELLALQGIHDSDWRKIHRMVAEVHDMNLKEFERICRKRFVRVFVEQAHDMRGTSLWMVYCSNT